MRVNRSIVAALLLSPVVMWVAMSATQTSPEPFTILRTEKGFVPQVLTVPSGTEVTFKNESGRPFWPASNVHPYHNVYPEFDPRQPVPSGESWTFRFDIEGTWLFHDHLAATQTGVVIVSGATSTDITNLPAVCPGTTSFEKRSCWNQRLTRAFTNKGLEAAFDEMKAIFDSYPGFAPQCHHFGHDLGLLARIRYGDDVPLLAKAGYCNEAFYHGYMQGYLEQNPDPSEAAQFCEHVDAALHDTHPQATEQCKHGVGHGLMEYELFEHSELWSERRLPELIETVLAKCDRAFDNESDLFRCASGGYNVLVDWLPLQNGYGSLFSAESPFRLCEVSSEAWARSACAWELAKAFRYLEKDLDDQLALLVRTASLFDGSAHMPLVIQSFGMSIAAQHWNDSNAALAAYCETLDSPLRSACIEGIVIRLLKYGPPGREFDRPLQFCSLNELSEIERSACGNALLTAIFSSYQKSEYERLCRLISGSIPSLQNRCSELPKSG